MPENAAMSAASRGEPRARAAGGGWPHWLPSRIALVIACCSLAGVALSLLVFHLAMEREERQILSEHERVALNQISVLQNQVDAVMHFALALQGFLSQNPDVGGEAFRRFYLTLMQDAGHRRLVRFIEWLRQVPARDLATFEAEQRRKRGTPGYFVWQPAGGGQRKSATGRPYYQVVEWIEPAEEHGGMVGLDSGHSPATQQAIWRARTEGRAAATAGFRLAQDPPGKTSVIVYAPVERSEAGALRGAGLAAVGISVQPLLEEALLPGARPGFKVRIYDEGIHGDERVLLAEAGIREDVANAWEVLEAPLLDRTVWLADRRWHIVCSGRYALPLSRAWPAWTLLGASLLITAALQFFLFHLHRQNLRIRREVQRRTRQLRRALRLAREAAEAKARFLAKISHEIRTPLNGIIGMTHLLMESGLTAEQQESARLILGAGQHLLAVVNDTLDLSKIEAGKLALVREPVQLRALLRESEKIFRPAAEQKGLLLFVETAPELPEWVEGDATRLRQVLWNLLGNAVKFTAQGQVSVAVRAGAEPACVRFEVRDTGPGIPQEDLARLFEPYFQSGTPGHRAEGTGLGLAISRRLVELMGGRIGCESRPGVGSLFWFEVPLPPCGRPRGAGPAGEPTRRPVPASVLLVEDNPVNQIVARRLLERLGCEVRVASSGEEALNLVRHAAFDLILMDCQMPGMDGFETTRRIRQMGGQLEHTPILALTAHALEQERRRCLACGMNGVLTKPVGLEELQKAVEAVLAAAAPRPVEPC